MHISIRIKATVGVGYNFSESCLYWEKNIGLNSGLIETKLAECFCILKGECSAPSALHGQNAVVPRSQQISGTGGNPVVKKPECTSVTRPFSLKEVNDSVSDRIYKDHKKII